MGKLHTCIQNYTHDKQIMPAKPEADVNHQTQPVSELTGHVVKLTHRTTAAAATNQNRRCNVHSQHDYRAAQKNH